MELWSRGVMPVYLGFWLSVYIYVHEMVWLVGRVNMCVFCFPGVLLVAASHVALS